MQYLEEKILYIDVGTAFLKAIVIKNNWRNIKKIACELIIPVTGISINGIENFQLFSTNINKLIYEIEYQISAKITKIILIFGYFANNYLTYTSTVNITNIVENEDLNKLHKNHMYDVKSKIIHYNCFFIVDHYLCTLNPVGMLCKFLTVRQNYLLMNTTLLDNINNIFIRNNYDVTNHLCGVYILSEYIRKFYHNFIIIDGGYYTTRLCLVENNMLKEFYTLNTGLYHLYQHVSLKYQISMEEASELVIQSGLLNGENEDIVRINQMFINNVLQKCLQSFKSTIANTLDIPIFLNGWSCLHPAEYYLKTKHNREIFVTSSYFNWPSQFEYLYAIFMLQS